MIHSENKDTGNKVLYLTLLFLILFVMIASRRPDILLNAQPWAEDGTIWMQSIHNDGFWSTIFLPQNGYYQTISKLSYGFGLLFGVKYAVLIANSIAISIRCLMVIFLLSSRFAAFRLYYRVFLAGYFILMPNLAEGYVNITNAHWYLAMYLMLTLIAAAPRSKADTIHDYLVLFISALSGPFIVFIAPCLIIKRIYERGGVYSAIKEVNSYDILFGCLSLIQVFAILSTFSETRVATTLGASYPLLADIILYKVFLGAFFDNVASIPLMQNSLLNVIIFSIFLLYLLLMLVRGNRTFKICFLFPLLMIGFALAKPMIASSGEQWPLLLFPGTGGRYFYVTNIFLFALLLYIVSQLGKYDKYILAVMFFIMAPLYKSYYKISALDEVGYMNSIVKYESINVGESMSIPINPPGWYLVLTKK